MTLDALAVPLSHDEKQKRLTRLPSMPRIFARALVVAPFRRNTPPKNKPVHKGRILMEEVRPDPRTQALYRRVCGFTPDPKLPLPPTYLQTLFVELLGTYIADPIFPITPMGLIQTGQSLRQERPVMPGERLDLTCALLDMTRMEKGIQTRFHLEIRIKGEGAWQGISTYFTRNGKKSAGSKTKKQDIPLSPRQIFKVPRNTGRRYAKASGDLNPHHLYPMTARLFGFKQPIAHGMWSLGRALAGIEREWAPGYPITLEAGFKLPVFMPATLALGWDELPPPEEETETTGTRLAFEIRDRHSHLPHLKGLCAFP